MDTIVKTFKRYWTYQAGGIIGGMGGFLYWHFIGCASGSCQITASSVVSTLWGILMGGLLFNLISGNKGGKS